MPEGSRRYVLPVGEFSPAGLTDKTVELKGVRLAEGERRRWLASGAGSTQISLQWSVFMTEGERPFVLHALLRSERGHVPLVGRLERFATEEELHGRHPDLAISGGHAAPRTPAPPAGPGPGNPKGPASSPPPALHEESDTAPA